MIDNSVRQKTILVYKLPFKEYRRLHDRAYRAQQSGHYEICGIMSVDQEKMIELVFLKNHSDRPYHFEVYTIDIRKAARRIKNTDSKKILGEFH